MNTTGSDALFSATKDLPTSSNAIGRLTALYCWSNDLSDRSQIQRIDTNFVNGVGDCSYPVTKYHTNKAVTINFSDGEHLVQVTMTRDNSTSAISSINFKTSHSKEYFIGNAVGERMVFTAPEKWRIVGFHGTSGSYHTDYSVSGSYRYPITKLGVIYAPIPLN